MSTSDISLGKLLPNLTVTLGDNSSITSSMDVDENKTEDPQIDSSLQIVRPTLINNQKIYMNKDGGFSTGIDLIELEKSGILNKRAERFGIDMEQPKPSISSLYESLGIDVKDKDSVKAKRLRLNAIHIRGVQNLRTDDVFDYFRGYGPDTLEWINDYSCNVIWLDEASCARALLNLSRPLPPEARNKEFIENTRRKKVEVIDISSEVHDNDEEKEEIYVNCISEKEASLEIPIPPGQWRLGVKHDVAETLLLRFATTGDKKLRNAEKRSKFYQKFGNPNYGGLKGLISSSRKYKTKVDTNRLAVKDLSSSLSSHPSDTYVHRSHKSKPLRMRMYADDEELIAKKIRSKTSFNESRPSVHSRLGKKHTSEDLINLRASNFASDHREIERDSPYPRGYDSAGIKSEKSTVDLRFKLKRLKDDKYPIQYVKRSYKKDSEYNYEQDCYEESENYSVKRTRVAELKSESRSIYKRKHRSPLCDDDDDEEEASSE